MMPVSREAVELLIQAARTWYFEGDRHGLRDREWMALRFLGRANRFSRTPSALADFIGATRATASQVIKTLENKSYLIRKPSHEDKRSVVLCVTPQGEKVLAEHDPLNHVLNAVNALGTEECVKLRDSLRQVLGNLDTTQHRLSASICRDCMFFAERTPMTGKGRAVTEFTCRLYRTPISLDEIGLLCASFERAGERPKLDELFGKLRVAR
jgi:MarR family transcriptional regulator, negative regulator of the multidrug operon emrRAB